MTKYIYYRGDFSYVCRKIYERIAKTNRITYKYFCELIHPYELKLKDEKYNNGKTHPWFADQNLEVYQLRKSFINILIKNNFIKLIEVKEYKAESNKPLIRIGIYKTVRPKEELETFLQNIHDRKNKELKVFFYYKDLLKRKYQPKLSTIKRKLGLTLPELKQIIKKLHRQFLLIKDYTAQKSNKRFKFHWKMIVNPFYEQILEEYY